MISFGHLWPAVLLLAAPFVWRTLRRTATGMSPAHLTWSGIARTAVVVLLATALMRPVWNRPVDSVSVAYALDVSSSVDPAFIETALAWIEQSVRDAEPAQASFIAFARAPRVVASAADIRSLEVASEEDGDVDRGGLDRGGTDIEAAVRRALRGFDPRFLKRLVLITDGNETQGDLMKAVGQAQEQGVRIYVLPAVVRGEGDAWVEAVELPEGPRLDEPVAAQVRAFARVATRATLELRDDGQLLAARDVDLEPGLNTVVFEIRLAGEGPVTLESRIRAAGDPIPQNDVFRQSIMVGERPLVLYVEGVPDAAHFLQGALEADGLDVTLASTTTLPDDLDGLEPFDAVILSDVDPQRLTPRQMLVLEAWVRDQGGGLVFAGGESSYGEEGYSDTPVEEILPIWFRINEERKDLALVIVLDKSFSMVGPKIELSKEAAKAALDLLEDTHRFGLLTFDHSPYWTVPLQPAANKERIKEFISSVIASAHTNIYPALERAYLALADTEAEVKHVILLSDGKTYPDDYETLVTRMQESEITVSTVAVGEEADRELLSTIAEWGEGRSYFIRDAARVPQVFIEETQLASQTTLVEDPFQPLVRRDIEALRGVDLASAPALRGYVSTQAKDTAEIILESPTQAPILARWQYGLGKAVAFTSDVKNRWAAEWLQWDGYGKFWAQVVRETMRRDPGDLVDFRVRRQGAEALVTVSAVGPDGRYRRDVRPEVTVVDPTGQPRLVPLRQVGAGSFEGNWPLRPSTVAPWVFRLGGTGIDSGAGGGGGTGGGGTGTDVPQRVLHYSFSDEHRLYPVNAEVLRAIATLTGGSIVTGGDEIFDDRGESARMPVPLWPWLATLALLVYLADIALRRVPWFYRYFAARGTARGSTGAALRDGGR